MPPRPGGVDSATMVSSLPMTAKLGSIGGKADGASEADPKRGYFGSEPFG